MDQYKNFGVEDFIWDAFFRQWVLLPTRETDAVWSIWLQNNAGMSDTIRQAKEIILSLHVTEAELSEEEIRDAIKQTLSKTDKPAHPWEVHFKRRNISVLKATWFRIAACIIFISIIGILSKSYILPGIVKENSIVLLSESDEKKDFVKKTNTEGIPILIELDDRSQVTLSPNSTIRYKRKFQEQKREVYLEGEAFFEVTKDHEHPFFVYANNLVTKVLGTSFRIRAYDSSDQVMVEVKTGRVSVFTRSDPKLNEKTSNTELEGVVLSPNQKIVYSKDHSRMVKTLE